MKNALEESAFWIYRGQALLRQDELDAGFDREVFAPHDCDGGEGAVLALDRVEHGPALWSQADVGRELELGHDRSIVRTILIRK